MNKRTTAAALLLGLALAGCGTDGDQGVRASAELGAAEEVAVVVTTATTALAGEQVVTTGTTGPATTTTRASTTTASTAPDETADLEAAEAARQAKESADRAEESAQRAEEAATAATSTTTTTAAPATTTTTVPEYGWVDVLSIQENGAWEAVLTGGPVRARDPKSTLKPMPLQPAGVLTLDDIPCDVQNGPDGDCLWREAPAAGRHVVRLDGASRFSEPVVVQEYR